MTETFGSGRQEAPVTAPRPRDLIDPDLLDRLRATLVSVTQPWWQGEFISKNGLIYGVNIAGSRPPLFWCFQGYEEFAAFGRALGPDQPLYGMRSGHLVAPTSAENHMHMAVILASEIHSLALAGPLFLGGNCQGALLAQKIAQILIAAGQAVSLLICLNPFIFMPYSGRAAMIVGRYDATNPFHRLHDADAALRANIPHSTVDILPSEHGKLFRGTIVTLLSDIVRRRMDEASQTHTGSFPVWSIQAAITAPAAMTMTVGSLCDVQITLRNTSDIAWAPTHQSGLSVGNHWRHADGSMVQWLDGLTSLNHPLLPGDSVDLVIMVRAPRRKGQYLLEFDVHHAGIMWLSEMGVKISSCEVSVSPSE